MAKSRKLKSTEKKKKGWRREIPDSILCLRGRAYDHIPCSPSLRPDAHLMERLIDGDVFAAQIVDAWRFVFPVTQVSA